MVYEWAAWCVLAWVVILPSGDENPLLWICNLILAPAIGAAVAMLVMFFEREFFVADMSINQGKKIVAAFGRVALILVSAVIAAQPLEAQLFRHQIAERHYDEVVRVEVVRIVEDLLEAEAKAARDNPAVLDQAMEGTLEVGGIDEATTAVATTSRNLEAARSALAQATIGVASAEKAVASAQEVVSGIERKPLELRHGLSSARRDLSAARTSLTAAREVQARSQAQVDVAQLDLEQARRLQLRARTDATIRRSSEEREREAERAAAAKELDKLQAWVDALVRGSPDKLPTNPSTRERLKIPEIGLMAELGLLDDVLEPRPPRWPPTSDAVKRKVEQAFPGVALAEKEIGERELAEAQGMRWRYRVSHLVFIFIPMLAVLYKLLMPEALQAYYSARAQARSGNEQARQLLDALDIPWQKPS